VKTGWQLILRSRNPYGPYEEKIVLHQGTTPINGPHQGAIVDTPGGEWWFIHFQDAGAYGRIVHLQPVRWQDDWPLMGVDINHDGIGEPVLEHRKPKIAGGAKISIPQTSDDFDGEKLGLQWQWHANHEDGWYSLTSRKGFLRLFAVSASDDFGATPNLLLQKLPATQFTAETVLELRPAGAGEEAGLIVMGEQHAALVVRQSDGAASLSYVIDNKAISTHPLPSAAAKLRVEMRDAAVCRFSYAIPGGEFQEIEGEFTAVAGGWIGAKVGVFCRTVSTTRQNGFADFEYFRFGALRK
jgi:beta-xylosidase